MDLEAIIGEVTALRDVLKPIVSDNSHHVLTAALASLNEQKRVRQALSKKAQAKAPPWVLVIKPDDPLTFRSTADESLVRHCLEVDVSCSLSEPDKNGVPRGDHNVAVRVWSTDLSMCFREDMDAATLRQPLEAQRRRVMLRFHFDLANEDQQGPRHHLQIGGKGMPRDYHWLPDNWKLPRFLHLPVDLALVCEFVGRTFYPKRFGRVSEDAIWRKAVRTAEESYVFPFFRKIPYLQVDPRRRNESLLSLVWNG